MESQVALKNCIEMANRALSIGAATADELDKQERQLDKMGTDVDVIDTNVQNAHRTLDNISSFIKSLFGSIKYPTLKPSNPINHDPTNHIHDMSHKNDDLDELYNLTVKMKELNISINKSIDRQTEKIQSLTERVDGTNRNIGLANAKIDELL